MQIETLMVLWIAGVVLALGWLHASSANRIRVLEAEVKELRARMERTLRELTGGWERDASS
jgi:hypothetical protein